MKLSLLSVILILPPLQGFSSRETDFHLLSNFLRYSASNFLLFHPYSNLAIYFPGSLLLLYSSLSCRLTSTFNLPLNSSTNFFVFSKSFFFSPCVIFCCKPLPLYQVLFYSSYFSFIQYSFYLPLFNSFYFNWFFFFFFLPSYLFLVLYYSTDIYYRIYPH